MTITIPYEVVAVTVVLGAFVFGLVLGVIVAGAALVNAEEEEE